MFIVIKMVVFEGVDPAVSIVGKFEYSWQAESLAENEKYKLYNPFEPYNQSWEYKNTHYNVLEVKDDE